MSEWKEIPGFSNYVIDEEATVRNLRSGRTLPTRLNQRGHVMVSPTGREGQKTRSLAVLVATAFEPNPPIGYDTVIHLNGDRLDCRAINLAWRPRWHAINYMRQFNEKPYRVGVYVPAIDRTYSSLRSFCIEFGLLEKACYFDGLTGDPCWHYHWQLDLLREDRR